MKKMWICVTEKNVIRNHEGRHTQNIMLANKIILIPNYSLYILTNTIYLLFVVLRSV